MKSEIPSHYRELKHDVLKKFLQNKEQGIILDIGSGVGVTGQLLKGVLPDTVRTISIDKDLKSLELCPTDKILSNGCKLSIKDNSVDAIILFDVLEHVKEDDALILECCRVLKKRGRLFISVPRMKQPLNFIPPQREGHVRRGYTWKQLKAKVASPGLNMLYHERKYFCLIAFTEDIILRVTKKALGDKSVPGTKGLTSNLMVNDSKLFNLYKELFSFSRYIRNILEEVSPSSLKRSHLMVALKS
jgi:2-polyprenyl-3-methyl-5-hydroxy-6-metoxy-1,4-benzoquinol methylase